MLASCAGPAPNLAAGAPAVVLVTAAHSGWQAADLESRIVPAGAGWELSIHSRGAVPAECLLLEVQFPPQYTAVDAQSMLPAGKLKLLVADRPGLLALGVIMPEGEVLPAGEVLRTRLLGADVVARHTSKAPAGSYGRVPDLAGVENGYGGWRLSWGYFNTGDLNQDGLVAISDLTLLGIHFGEQSPGFPDPFPADSIGAVVDTSGNGQIGLTDLAPLGINYASRVDGYRVYKADGPDPETAASVKVAEALFSTSTLVPGSRRRFEVVVPSAGLADGAYYFVRPFELATGLEGAASNVLPFQRTIHLKYYLPGSGDYVVDGGQCQNPSLVLMPPLLGISEPGAPVIVYTALGGGGGLSPLMLAYYGEGGWVTEDIGDGGNFTMGQAMWLPGAGGDPGTGMVVACDIAGARIVDRRYDASWSFSGSSDVGPVPGTFTALALDQSPATGTFGVAYAAGGPDAGSVMYCAAPPAGSWSQHPPVYEGEAVGGLSFRFDQAGGDPWLLFTHGTTTATTGLISLDYSLEQGRLHGNSWNITPVQHPDSPLQVDLGFRENGTPQIACIAARDFTLNIPGLDPWTITMLYDVVTAERTGTAWSFEQGYESGMGISLEGFPPTTLVLELNLASDAEWAKPDELSFTQATGNIKIDLETYLPEDGGLATDTAYLKRQGGAVYSESGYYSGAAGRTRSWQQNQAGQPVCAYIRSSSISAADVIGGNFAAAGELAFWLP